MQEKATAYLNRSALRVFLVSLVLGLFIHFIMCILTLVECFVTDSSKMINRMVWMAFAIANLALGLVWLAVFVYNHHTLQFDRKLFDFYRLSVLLAVGNAFFFASIAIVTASLFTAVDETRFRDWIQVYYLVATPFLVPHVYSGVQACSLCNYYLNLLASTHSTVVYVPLE